MVFTHSTNWLRRSAAALDVTLARRLRRDTTPDDAARGIARWELPSSSIRVRDTGGSGPVFVIVPDPPNTIEHYDRLIERLAPAGRVVCFEVPGFGLSYPRAASFGFGADDFAQVLVEVLHHAEVRDVTLMMSCIGGYVALLVARRHPELVAQLLLSQTPTVAHMRRWARRFDRIGVLGMPLAGQALIHLIKDRATRFWYANALPEGVDPAPYLAPALEAQRRGGPYALASGIQAMRRLDPSTLAGVEQPVTVVWGGADRTHTGTDPRSLLEVVPHARFVPFDRSGHFPDLEDVERFSALALASHAGTRL
jgi:pimeloyl-ACP methyl ester carboxylesterase